MQKIDLQLIFFDPLLKQEGHLHVRGAAFARGRLHRPLRRPEEVGLPKELRQRQ